MDKVYLTEEKISRDIRTLVNQVLLRSSFKPNIVLGIARGGVVPAVYLSHALDIAFYVVNIGSYTENNKQGELKTNQPLPEFNGKDILIVDDLVDTGDTMKFLLDKYSVANRVKTAVLYNKQASIISPDYFVEIFDKEEWIEFPWESM